MTQYRKKPVVIDTMRYLPMTADEVAAWCGGKLAYAAEPSYPDDIHQSMLIPTPEGTMRADLGDWIIRGVKGEFYPCKPDVFEETYELVGEA